MKSLVYRSMIDPNRKRDFECITKGMEYHALLCARDFNELSVGRLQSILQMSRFERDQHSEDIIRTQACENIAAQTVLQTLLCQQYCFSIFG